ncbi:UNVERIFIED_CONTAM: hypothetical protein GTU68_011054 [Idotea baltica]|nr:hypothetical protein [Idotea baltica]
MGDIAERGYVNSDVLVSTEWLADNLNNPDIRIVESNEDQLLYKSGHIPNAVEVDWVKDLNDPIIRDYLQKDGFNDLVCKLGITPETQVVFYGDKNNWWACYAFWIFQLYGHTNAKIVDGGRLKWELENRELTKEVPTFDPSNYPKVDRDDSKERMFRDGVLNHIESNLPLVDVRSNPEYTGERLHMEGYPNEGALRGGHIPGAVNVPWPRAINPDDGSFKTAEELKAIYEGECNLKEKDQIVAYCRIGERSSHTWFVLKYLLGYANVKNYDGSWCEWGNLVNVPIEK